MDKQTQTRVRHWLQRADEYLRAAEHEFNGEFYARSISTSYYTMFYAATGALASIGVERKGHIRVVSAFGEHFTKSGKISKEFSLLLIEAKDQCKACDYSANPKVDRTSAQKQLDEAHGFVSAVTKRLALDGLMTHQLFN